MKCWIVLCCLFLALPALAAEEWTFAEGRWTHTAGFSLKLPEGFEPRCVENRLQARRGPSYLQFMPVSQRSDAENTVNKLVEELRKQEPLEFSALQSFQRGQAVISLRSARATLDQKPVETSAGFVTLKDRYLLFYSITSADEAGTAEFVRVLESVSAP